MNAQLYMGVSLGPSHQQFARVHIEDTESFFRMDFGYMTDFNSESLLQLKAGFGGKINQWGLYAYLPYFNYKLGKGYNTPFCFEIFYSNWASLNVDIYQNKIIPSIRIKTIILK